MECGHAREPTTAIQPHDAHFTMSSVERRLAESVLPMSKLNRNAVPRRNAGEAIRGLRAPYADNLTEGRVPLGAFVRA